MAAECLELQPLLALELLGHSTRGAALGDPLQWRGVAARVAEGAIRGWLSCQLPEDLLSYVVCWSALKGASKASDHIANTPGAECWCCGR